VQQLIRDIGPLGRDQVKVEVKSILLKAKVIANNLGGMGSYTNSFRTILKYFPSSKFTEISTVWWVGLTSEIFTKFSMVFVCNCSNRMEETKHDEVSGQVQV
jgi:hypothetical protein